jgi:hypothetical protein
MIFSEPKRGSSFSFTLPPELVHSAQTLKSQPAKKSAGG